MQPRYDQIKISDLVKPNTLSQILSPNSDDQGVWIHQNAWFHMGEFDQSTSVDYEMKSEGNGVYAFVLEGEVNIDGQSLDKRDGFGIWNTDKISLRAEAGAKVLLMEVPMN